MSAYFMHQGLLSMSLMRPRDGAFFLLLLLLLRLLLRPDGRRTALFYGRYQVLSDGYCGTCE